MLEMLAVPDKHIKAFKTEKLPNYPFRVNGNTLNISNGVLFSYGGRQAVNGVDTAAAYRYSPGGSWVNVQGGVARSFHVAETIEETGEIVVFGGRNTNNALASPALAKYNLDTNTWTNFTNNASFPGRITASSFIHNNYLYVFGGLLQSGAVTDAFTRVNLTTGVWENVPRNNVPPARNYSWMVKNRKDGLVYLVGGNGANNARLKDFYQFNPATNAWTKLADFPFATSGHLISEIDGEIYVSNGWNYTTGLLSQDIYHYNKTKDQWEKLPTTLTVAQYAPSGVSDKSIYMLGGSPSGATSAAVQEFYSLT